MSDKKRHTYFAVLKTGEIVERNSKKQLLEVLEGKSIEDVYFVCRGKAMSFRVSIIEKKILFNER